MTYSILMDELRAAGLKADEGSTRKAVLERLEECLRELGAWKDAPETSDRLRVKVSAFLDHVLAARATLGTRFFHPAFVINVAGEAMARADLIARPVVELVQVGLYFFGFDQIEKRWSARAAVYSGIHADHLQAYVSRDTLKALVEAARERIAQGKVFCLTWHYLNSLRKAYWKHCRRSEDALDVAVTGDVPSDARHEPAAPAIDAIEAIEDPREAGKDRVALMLKIFQDGLSARQRWIYLAKNRSLLASGGTAGDAEAGAADPLARLLADLGAQGCESDLGWSEIAERLGINEKTAKREYLKSLHTLLRSSAEAVFGHERIPSHYVRRVLESIRAVVYEKDLRLKSSTGRGLETLVEKWEVALRFVLNHQRIPA